MTEEVDPSGRISLGIQYAGRKFEMLVHPGGRLELIPAREGAPQEASHEAVEAPDGWLPPGGYGAASAWALENREALENYARENADEGTAAEQLQQFLAGHPDALNDRHGEI